MEKIIDSIFVGVKFNTNSKSMLFNDMITMPLLQVIGIKGIEHWLSYISICCDNLDRYSDVRIDISVQIHSYNKNTKSSECVDVKKSITSTKTQHHNTATIMNEFAEALLSELKEAYLKGGDACDCAR